MAFGLFQIFNYTNPTSLTHSLSPYPWTHHHPKTISFKPQNSLVSPPASFPVSGESRRSRGASVVTRAGPTATTYALAFALPFSLIVITVVSALRIGNKLDQQYLEEVLLSEAIREANEDDDEEDDDDDDEDVDDDIEIELPLEKPVSPRTRNRPIREI